MRDNPVQFAVVREDPSVEMEIVRRADARRVLLIASGGCTALSLRTAFPKLDVTLLDPNGAQLERVAAKADALKRLAPGTVEWRRIFNVGDADPEGLNADGNFESLFRGLSAFIQEHVVPATELESLLTDPSRKPEIASRLLAHRYWPVAFELFFSDALLRTMFGPEAVRHAVPGSYPTYFRSVIERGLLAPGSHANPFLHHFFLGKYLVPFLPPYLIEPPADVKLKYIHGKMDAIADLAPFDVVGLSNIFDWSSDAEIVALVRRLAAETRPGASVVFRQLNHSRDFRAAFAPEFRFDDDLAARLHAADRSLFYSSLSVGVRR